MDAELSPLVKRTFSLASPPHRAEAGREHETVDDAHDEMKDTVLRTHYRATTNRMLRVAVNGFMESVGVVLQVMEELDVDVLESALRTAA